MMLPDFASAVADAIRRDAWQDAAFPVQRFEGVVRVAGCVASVEDFADLMSRSYNVESPPAGAWGDTCRLYASVRPAAVALEELPTGDLFAVAELRYRDPSR